METIEKIQRLESFINNKMKNNKITIQIKAKPNEKQGKIIIYKNKKIDKKLEFECVSLYTINIKEKGILIEEGLFIDYLAMWLYNLYNSVQYIYKFFGGKLNKSILTREQIDKISDGLTTDYNNERKIRITAHRKELDNQPTVKEYLGPIYENIGYGKIYLRYETQEIYDMLST